MTIPKMLTRTRFTSEAELLKRRRLRAELDAELAAPLTPGVNLSKREQAAIVERVRGGISNQSVFPRGGGAHKVSD